MRLGETPVVRSVIDAGPDDRVFDAMLLSGPVVLAVLAVFGRTAITVGVVALYLAVFVGYVLYKAATYGRA